MNGRAQGGNRDTGFFGERGCEISGGGRRGAGRRRPSILLLLAMVACAMLVWGCTKPTIDATGTQSTGNIASDAVAGAGQNIHNSLESGKKTECQSNLQQLRSAIQMHKDSEGTYPSSLSDLGPAMRSLESCPSSSQPYQYDPASGRVWCTTPGHEKL